MISTLTAWLAVRLPAAAQHVLAAPGPTPTPSNGPGGFDWDRVHPDGSAIPKSGIFYTIMNAVMWLGGVAAFCGLVAGAIAFGVGPIFGAHIVSDRGKSMMWRNGLVAIIVGSATAIIAGLLVL
ncbi:hypothetical protein COUCH_14275 [Couchioplanes caeruleus]|jgi:hypothetical protein|uniref:hypothetical protein n=1 Tax=Couchioplanes caeruleus TaxID=56438 RepID=UPI0020BFC8A9|nr:hypothetical protein [Couchioplanes caeruleus]UQU67355.1 hypothetical protein COUCH_14275 [Couchioplanes caeruleus]